MSCAKSCGAGGGGPENHHQSLMPGNSSLSGSFFSVLHGPIHQIVYRVAIWNVQEIDPHTRIPAYPSHLRTDTSVLLLVEDNRDYALV